MDFFAKLAFVGIMGGSIITIFGTVNRLEAICPVGHKLSVQTQQIGIAFLVIGTLSHLFG